MPPPFIDDKDRRIGSLRNDKGRDRSYRDAASPHEHQRIAGLEQLSRRILQAAAGFDETSVVLSSQDLCDPLCQRFAPFGKLKQRRFLHFVASRNSVVKPGS